LQLKELLSGYACKNMLSVEFLDTEVLGITSDSREVEPGFIFAALLGDNVNGYDFIMDAVNAGAVAVVTSNNTPSKIKTNSSVCFIPDPNPRKRYSKMVGKFYKPQPQHVVAVTGTNGKSSVAEFTRQIWQICDRPAASIGTLGLVAPWGSERGYLTTPDPIKLHKALVKLNKGGIEHVIIEASSHGLSQFRLDGIDVGIAAFTNLSRDHLDYHKTMENYFNAKHRLFTEILNPDGVAVINSDDKMAIEISKMLKKRNINLIDFGKNANNIILENIEIMPDGQKISVSVFGQTCDVMLPLLGNFQSMNVLCALAIAIAGGLDPEEATRSLSKLKGVKGRMELAACMANGSRIFVDYAHTPDALENVLNSLRAHTKNKLKIVFGCGGNRDHGKRPKMGKIAAQLADEVIITDDNPRYENAAQIRAQIKSVSPGAIEIADRLDAIATAVKSLSTGDLLVIAGKGHEKGQLIDGVELPFDDIEAVRSVVRGNL
jgi:UDP-N-acetylmuramoyl-L-alanyl-D-glutamate--2,6-diaminopimelate ligase